MLDAEGRLLLGVLAALIGCGDAPATRARDADWITLDPDLPVLQLEVVDTVTGFAAGGDSIYLDGAIGARLAGDTVYVLHPREGVVIRHSFVDGVTATLGRKGEGQGDVDPMSDAIAVSGTGTVAIAASVKRALRVWTSEGDVLYTRWLGQPAAPWPLMQVGLKADREGRVYAALDEWDDDEMVRVRVRRYGPAPTDSAELPYLLEKEQPLRVGGGFVSLGGYVFRDGPGALLWTVGPDGLIYIAYGDQYRVDTLRIGGRRATLVAVRVEPPPELSRDEVEKVVARATVNGQTLRPEDVMPVRRATISSLHHSGTHLWVGRPPEREMRGKFAYDVVDDRGAVVARVLSPYDLTDVSGWSAISWTVGPNGEQMLLRLAPDEDARLAASSPAVQPVRKPQ